LTTTELQTSSILAPLQLRIDIDNDGIDELTEQMTGLPQHVRRIGPVPLVTRWRINATATQPGSAQVTIGVAVRPGPHTVIQQISTGCTPLPFLVDASPFGNNLLFSVPCLGNCVPRVVVLGLSVQPQVVPSLSNWCGLLLPSPDAILYAGPNVSFYGIPLPAAARPLDIYAQSVWVYPTTLLTTGSYRIAAY
jgi:hypothetical protein